MVKSWKNKQVEDFQSYLDSTGLVKYCKNETDLDISLWHDLKIYGDIAESYLEVLNEIYDVDVSKLNFDHYFPAEFPGETCFQRWLIQIIPLMRARYHSKKTYQKMTFRDIKRAIEKGAFKQN